MSSSDMVPSSALHPGHTGICARTGSTKDEVLYVPYHHCTSQPAASNQVPPSTPVPRRYPDQCNAGNTRMIPPTGASYLSPVLPCRRSTDRLSQPSHAYWRWATHHYPSAYSCLPPEAPAEVLPQEPEHNRTSHI